MIDPVEVHSEVERVPLPGGLLISSIPNIRHLSID
jgi:hypothetical protein